VASGYVTWSSARYAAPLWGVSLAEVLGVHLILGQRAAAAGQRFTPEPSTNCSTRSARRGVSWQASSRERNGGDAMAKTDCMGTQRDVYLAAPHAYLYLTYGAAFVAILLTTVFVFG
jgi:hypothetical protein